MSVCEGQQLERQVRLSRPRLGRDIKLAAENDKLSGSMVIGWTGKGALELAGSAEYCSVVFVRTNRDCWHRARALKHCHQNWVLCRAITAWTAPQFSLVASGQRVTVGYLKAGSSNSRDLKVFRLLATGL